MSNNSSNRINAPEAKQGRSSSGCLYANEVGVKLKNGVGDAGI